VSPPAHFPASFDTAPIGTLVIFRLSIISNNFNRALAGCHFDADPHSNQSFQCVTHIVQGLTQSKRARNHPKA